MGEVDLLNLVSSMNKSMVWTEYLLRLMSVPTLVTQDECSRTQQTWHSRTIVNVLNADAGQRDSNWGFSKGAAAGIIVSAVIFGLLAGVATGCAVIRCYTVYIAINSGENLCSFAVYLQCMPSPSSFFLTQF